MHYYAITQIIYFEAWNRTKQS